MFLSDIIPQSVAVLPSLDWRQIPNGLLPTAEYVTNTAGPEAMYPNSPMASTMAGLYGLRDQFGDETTIYANVTNTSCAQRMVDGLRNVRSGKNIIGSNDGLGHCADDYFAGKKGPLSASWLNNCCPSSPSGSGGSNSGTDPGNPDIVIDTGSDNRCAAIGGKCIDTNKASCSVATKSGYCPGASNVRCCTGTVTVKKSSVPVDPPGEPSKVYASPPPGVNTAGFGIVPMIIIGLIGIGVVYEISQRK